jgi:hypothetical protein
MRIVSWSLALALAVPALLLAVVLGPVTVGILCALGSGLVVFVIANAVLAVGAAGSRLIRRASGS